MKGQKYFLIGPNLKKWLKVSSKIIFIWSLARCGETLKRLVLLNSSEVQSYCENVTWKRTCTRGITHPVAHAWLRTTCAPHTHVLAFSSMCWSSHHISRGHQSGCCPPPGEILQKLHLHHLLSEREREREREREDDRQRVIGTNDGCS